jgi:hypothetical protein
LYKDFYLKFADPSEANETLFTEVPTEFDTEGNATATYQKPNYANIDVLGTLYHDDAELDEEGNVVTPATPLEGWHVNVRPVEGEDAAALEPFNILPSRPRRVWA